MKIAIIGAGNMGGAVARGVAAAGIARVCVSNPSPAKLSAIQHQYPSVMTTHSNADCVKDADVVVIAVKPWLVESVLTEISRSYKPDLQALVSVAAGISLEQLAEWSGAPETAAIYRLIPNTAASVGESMTFISGIRNSEESDAMMESIFKAMGSTMQLPERLMGAGTAVASCGIAYAMRFIRAMEEGGVELGLYPAQAREAILQTLIGAAKLLSQPGTHPETEIDKVTTPGGLTIKGLNAMEEAGFTNAVIQGLKKSVK